MWDAHQQVLVAVALLEDRIERLSHSVTYDHQHSGSCRQSGSHRHRSQLAGHPLQVLQAASHHGGSVRQAKSPSPCRLRWLVTFTKPSHESSSERDAGIGEPHPLTWSEWGLGDPSNWSRAEEDLECPPPLGHSPGGLSGWSRRGETTPSRLCHLSPPSIIVPSGLSGMWSSLTLWHGGESSLRSPARVTSRSLHGGSGHHSSYPRWIAMPKRWPMTIQHCQPITLWTGTNFCPFPI